MHKASESVYSLSLYNKKNNYKKKGTLKYKILRQPMLISVNTIVSIKHKIKSIDIHLSMLLQRKNI